LLWSICPNDTTDLIFVRANIPKKKGSALSCRASCVDVIDHPVKTWRQQVPPEAPIVHRLDMGSPPILREPEKRIVNTPGYINKATLLKYIPPKLLMSRFNQL